MTTFNFFAAQGKPDYEFDRGFYDDVYGIIDGVRMGFGEAIVSAHMIRQEDCFDIVNHQQEFKSPVVLCFIKNRYFSSLQKQIIEQLKQNAPYTCKKIAVQS